MNRAEFFLDGVRRSFSIAGGPAYEYGGDEFLSRPDTDLTFGQPWYEAGFAVADFLAPNEFLALRKGVEESIGRIVGEELSIPLEDFRLEHYHRFARDQAAHLRVVSRTRDLFAEDFCFPVMELIPRLEQLLGFGLTDIFPGTDQRLHIIVRINRPGSNDFNPVHKDIYEIVDADKVVPQFVNFWIPVLGVTPKTSLPVAPGSHRINENAVLRTFEGGVLEGNTYRVRAVKSWAGHTDLVRTQVQDGQVLMFSPHLIHGLAVNDETDLTRVALEFRLFKREV